MSVFLVRKLFLYIIVKSYTINNGYIIANSKQDVYRDLPAKAKFMDR